MRFPQTVLMLVAGFLSTEADAADTCTATALMNIPAGGMGYSARKGERIEAITQYTKTEGRWYYCSHGGGCYSALVNVGGKPVKAIRLNNCYVDFTHVDASYGDLIYYVRIDRKRNSAAALRYEDIDNRFLEIGYAPPLASTAAMAYIHRPASPCGRLARMVLEGNPDARRRLNADTNACTAEWRR
jgi:hypothetical protein